jgi:pyrroloquinoline quinone biosynthesis protein B
MPRLTAIVLGSAAGGGVPQWNCNCRICALARKGNGRVRPRTQMGLAVSGDGDAWILINASPDLRIQLAEQLALHPRELRESPVKAVVLTGAEIDQTAGLLSLRERQPFDLYATAETLQAIEANPMFDALAADLVRREAIALDRPFKLPGGVEAGLFGVPGKPPLYLESRPDAAKSAGINVGIELRAGDARLVAVPGAAAIEPELVARLSDADLLLFDGTVFTDDEMIRTGTGTKTGRRMGHIPVNGSDGSLAALASLSGRRVFIHINNTNPILIEDSPERRHVEAAGWQVAHDGMELRL